MRLTTEQHKLLSAASRHARDAEHLLEQGSHQSQDQAWHLAGFAPECLRKACLEDRAFDHALGHDLGARGEGLLDWAIALDPRAWRYALAEWSSSAPCLLEWRPDHRYERTGTRSGAKVEELVSSARHLVDRVRADLWADGVIAGREE